MTYCLLFDSDGTLVDSEAINTEALADELQLQGIDEHKDSLLARYRGWQFKALLNDLGKTHQQTLDEAFENRFRVRASNYFDDRLGPIPNVVTALRQLSHAKCVASNAPMKKLRQVLNKTGLISFFNDKLFSAYDISHFKPDPALFHHAARQMGFPSDKCIVIEDSDVGVQAATSAGMKCVHYQQGSDVPNTASPITGFSEFLANPNIIEISDMRELPLAISEFELRS